MRMVTCVSKASRTRGGAVTGGGGTGAAYVYDAETGAPIADYLLTPEDPRFINDNVLAKELAENEEIKKLHPAVARPGRMPGMNPPCLRRLSATSSTLKTIET